MILAPVVRDRKGEFADLFADMQAQGYVRFRVDGKTVEAADVPKLKKAEKHDIDVVIDRIRVQPRGIEQRLAESYEAALRIADGRALAVELDAAVGDASRRAAEHLFSSKFACPLCDYSLPELEPRLFSFNSPVGACPTCGGLGVTTVFDADRVVAFPRSAWRAARSRAGTGATPTPSRCSKASPATTASTSTRAFEDLPETAREVLLRGSGSEEIEFVYEAEGARGKTRAGQAQASVRRHPAQPRAPLQARPTRPRCART